MIFYTTSSAEPASTSDTDLALPFCFLETFYGTKVLI